LASIESIRLLTAKSPRFSREGASYDRLRWEDIAAALSRVKDPEIAIFGRLLVADIERKTLERIERKMLLDIVDIATEEKWTKGKTWKNHKKDTLRKLIRLAIVERLVGHICPSCNGNRGVMIAKKWKICPRCRGFGSSTITDMERARLIDIHPDTYRDVWRQRYRCSIHGVLDRYEARIGAALREA